jgi:hypothetical protein
MKTLFISTNMMRSSFLFLFTILSVNVAAKDLAMVDEVKGRAFLFNHKGGAFKVYSGAMVKDMNELKVEEGSQVTLSTPDNHVLHLSSGTHIKFLNKMIELKSGNLWIQSMKSTGALEVQTPNSIGKLKQAEVIYSFDDYYNRSQVMVINGSMTFANIMEEELKYEIGTGKFSILENKQNDGIPRQPTSVGKHSFGRIVSLFQDIKAGNKFYMPKVQKKVVPQPKKMPEPVLNREIASVKKNNAQIIFIDSVAKPVLRNPASADGKPVGAADYYKSLHQKKPKKSAVEKTGKEVNVRVFGPVVLEKVPVQAKAVKPFIKKEVQPEGPIVIKSKREPASVPTKVSEKTNLVQELKRSSVFEKSLQNEVQQQKRHTQERNKLIDELKSFDQAYKKEY